MDQKARFVSQLRSGQGGQTIGRVFRSYKRPSQPLKRILSQLSAQHLDTPITNMKTNYNTLQTNLTVEGNEASKWFPDGIFWFIMSHNPPKAWYHQSKTIQEIIEQGNVRPLEEEHLQLVDTSFESDPETYASEAPETTRQMPVLSRITPLVDTVVDRATPTPTASRTMPSNLTPRVQGLIPTQTVSSSARPTVYAPVKTMHRVVRRIEPTMPSRLSKGAVRRLARRGGVKRISGEVYREANSILKVFLKNIIESAVLYVDHAKRKTVTPRDIVMALKSNSYNVKTLYS